MTIDRILTNRCAKLGHSCVKLEVGIMIIVEDIMI